MHSGAIDSGTGQGNAALVKRYSRAVKLQRSGNSRRCNTERPGRTIVRSGRSLFSKLNHSILELALVQVAVVLNAGNAQALHA